MGPGSATEVDPLASLLSGQIFLDLATWCFSLQYLELPYWPANSFEFDAPEFT